MAHGGHFRSSNRPHYHSRSYSSSSSGSAWIVLIIIIIIFLLLDIQASNIGGKKPLEEKFEVNSQYLYDETGYFSDSRQLVEGLQYLYEKTNVQVVVMTTKSNCSDSKAVELYYEMFSDEGHILIIVPEHWYSSAIYYAIGDVANTVIDDNSMNYLLNKINSSKSGTKWKESLIEFADKLIDE